ncbi:MAG: exopolyphosphatase [Finegoldia sp.]|nr:exopolyphosphatase [Finegoldia sp.]
MICAVTDIGSNTIKLSVYKIVDGIVKNLFSEKESAGLVSYLEDGKLSEEGIEILIEVLGKFQRIISNFDDIEDSFAIATATIRNATNRKEILERVKSKIGIEIEVLSGEEEAKFAFIGAAEYVGAEAGVLTDIGGASAEVVIFDHAKVMQSTSIDIGSLSAFRNFSSGLFLNKDEKKKLEKEVKKLLDKSKISKEEHEILCAVGGSARACGKLYNSYFGKDPDNLIIVKEDLDRLIDEVTEMTDKEKFDLIIKIKADRIHTLIPGMIILTTIAKYFSSDIIKISNTGLREGYIYNKVLNN